MVLLTTTPTILTVIGNLDLTSPSSLRLDDGALPTSLADPIAHSTIISLSRHTSSSLNALLRGTKPYVAPPQPKPVQTAEYKNLMARLHAEKERRDYLSMLDKQEGTVETQERDDISPSLVLNMVLSVVMCAVAAFVVTRWWSNDGLRVLFSLGVGLVVGVAEVGVYAAYLRKVEESRAKERRKREKKEFICEYVGEDAEATTISDEKAVDAVESTQIWGRGVHGGMRRRVREKWEKEQEQDDQGQAKH